MSRRAPASAPVRSRLGKRSTRAKCVHGSERGCAQIVRGQVRVICEHATGEIIQRACQFGSGEATACDDKHQERPATRGIRLRVGMLERIDNMIADADRVGQRFELERAVWLGCARKYITLLNGQSPMLITSLHYFTGLVEEVSATSVPASYWLHVQRKAEQLERRWLASRSSATAEEQDEMMETK